MTQTSSPIEIGDLVRLKSGGPPLVVSWTAGMASVKIYLPGSIEGLTAIGFDSGGTPITVSAPVVCFERLPTEAASEGSVRSD